MTGLRWTAVTIDRGDNAKDAFDRVTIPQDVLDRIAPTALPRSSIVISDEPLNRETNYRTEFVVVLNNQPQGGLAMRERPDEDEPVADRNGWDGGFFGFGRWAVGTPNTSLRARAAASTIISGNGEGAARVGCTGRGENAARNANFITALRSRSMAALSSTSTEPPMGPRRAVQASCQTPRSATAAHALHPIFGGSWRPS